jgi:hypothetical protein
MASKPWIFLFYFSFWLLFFRLMGRKERECEWGIDNPLIVPSVPAAAEAHAY